MLCGRELAAQGARWSGKDHGKPEFKEEGGTGGNIYVSTNTKGEGKGLEEATGGLNLLSLITSIYTKPTGNAVRNGERLNGNKGVHSYPT